MTGWNVAEIAPAVPALVELLPPLGMLCILWICFGMVHGIDAIVRGFFGNLKSAVGWIPYAGEVISSPIHKIEQKIVSFLAGLEADIDHAIGHFWHSLAATAEHWWHTLERESELLWRTLQFLAGVTTLHELLHAERWLRRLIKAVEAAAVHALHHAVHFLEKWLRSIAHEVYPRLKWMEHELTRTIPREITDLRKWLRSVEHDIARLWRRVKELEQSITVGAIEAVVIAALATVGLDWIACRSRNSVNGKSGCGLWNDLEGLLGLFTSTLALTDVCAFLPFLESAFGHVAGPIINLLTVVPIGGCEKPPKSWATLSVAAGPLPPVQTLGPLAQ